MWLTLCAALVWFAAGTAPAFAGNTAPPAGANTAAVGRTSASASGASDKRTTIKTGSAPPRRVEATGGAATNPFVSSSALVNRGSAAAAKPNKGGAATSRVRAAQRPAGRQSGTTTTRDATPGAPRPAIDARYIVPTVDKVAFGLWESQHVAGHPVRDLVNRTSSSTYLNFYKGGYVSTQELQGRIGGLMTSAGTIHFALDGMFARGQPVGPSVARLARTGERGGAHAGNVTNWELSHVVGDAALLAKTVFHFDGKSFRLRPDDIKLPD